MNGHYFEVIIAGHHEYIKGFISGFITGSGLRWEAFFGEDYDFDEENVIEMLGRLVGIRDEHTVIVVESQLLNILKELLDRQGRTRDLKILSIREIKEESFTFSIRTFSRESGEKLDRILSEASSVLKITPPYAPREQEIPEGKGVEAYAPLHDYEFQARGSIAGECGEVFRCYGKLKRYEVVELGPMEIAFVE
ncbi:MAG: hypothetical protein M0P16_12880 [Syntrophales bacterium]|nr:hypothetical protein [Syntrophales bacterium]